MADGDYERGRDREIAALRARLAAFARSRASAPAARPAVFVLNGWSASPAAWDLCAFPRARLFSYLEQLDGADEAALAADAGRVVLVGWSMGGARALQLACRHPARIAGLVLVATTPRMMEEPATGWKGMNARRLDALWRGAELTRGAGLFGPPPGKPNPYAADVSENLARGIAYLRETDLRAALAAAAPQLARARVAVFQSERDGIVRAANADYLAGVFPAAHVVRVPGAEHALPVFVPGAIDAAVAWCCGEREKP